VAIVLETWPTHVGGKEFPDVPKTIGSAADEAHRCLSIDANRAAIAMARAVVEATAKEKGITKGNIEAKIDELHKQGYIRADTKEAAHEVRLTGNETAHGDLAAAEITKEEATDVIILMDDIIEEVYQSPARVKRVRENREARKRGPVETRLRRDASAADARRTYRQLDASFDG
jgi:hypothetical protein